MWAVESSYPPGWGWGGTGHSTLLLLDPLHFLLIMTWPPLAPAGSSGIRVVPGGAIFQWWPENARSSLSFTPCPGQ